MPIKHSNRFLPHLVCLPMILYVLDGCLCLICENYRGEAANLWFLKKNMQGDRVLLVIKESTTNRTVGAKSSILQFICRCKNVIVRLLFHLKRDAIINYD